MTVRQSQTKPLRVSDIGRRAHRRRLLAALLLAWSLQWFRNYDELVAFLNDRTPYQQTQAKVLVVPATMLCHPGPPIACTVTSVLFGLLWPSEPPAADGDL